MVHQGGVDSRLSRAHRCDHRVSAFTQQAAECEGFGGLMIYDDDAQRLAPSASSHAERPPFESANSRRVRVVQRAPKAFSGANELLGFSASLPRTGRLSVQPVEMPELTRGRVLCPARSG